MRVDPGLGRVKAVVKEPRAAALFSNGHSSSCSRGRPNRPRFSAMVRKSDAPTRAREHASWLRGWLQHRARPLPPEAVTRYHRLRAQAIGLLTEAAALTEALESVNEAQAMH